ncbi:excinuclease ABC subunit UvrA [symbiont of Argiope bruennichi]|uniref:excinuclease ABC subunit UvrA n=1 Tax=symbiont of Argiope bruennichi TaxID=2810479 RepID=UPI003DA5EB88
MEKDYIKIYGAKEHNLKDIDLQIPKKEMVVITGISGSGKSSLAFYTIYSEGKRRYLESLSSYARQFLGTAQKSKVDKIEGLSPTISIDQKTTSHNPRSTVGTVTEIYDYLRLLYAKIAKPYCPDHGLISKLSTEKIISEIYKLENNSQIFIFSPVVTLEKGTHINLINKLKKDGFIRLRVNNVIYNLLEDSIPELEKTKKHTIEILVERMILLKDDENQLHLLEQAINVACEYSFGLVIIEDVKTKKQWRYSKNFMCSHCGFTVTNPSARLFSFNSPIGACPKCKGLGFDLECDFDMMFKNKDLSILNGGVEYFKNPESTSKEYQRFLNFCKHFGISVTDPVKNLPKKDLDLLFYGNKEVHNTLTFEGLKHLIERRYKESTSDLAKNYYKKFIKETKCSSCHGKRLNNDALCYKISNKNIYELGNLSIDKLADFFEKIEVDPIDLEISKSIIKEILTRLHFLIDVGLNYLTINRSSTTLSGGESQRIRLSTQIGSNLSDIIYVLDEPSIGLHQKDNISLINALKKIRDLKNTLIIVEHDEEIMKESDYLIDIGPYAGEKGGEIVGIGKPKNFEIKNFFETSITNKFLSKELKINFSHGSKKKVTSKFIKIVNATENNLKNVTLNIPLNKLVLVTGVSGSGKSSLITNVLYTNLKKYFNEQVDYLGKCEQIKNANQISKVILISQDPIGKTSRSNPATYTGVFTEIRNLFAGLPEAKSRGLTASHFSFNVPGGRCEKCEGDGILKISMLFLPDVVVQCDECHGKRYKKQVLKVKYKNKNIYDVLMMSVDEAYDFFKNITAIEKKLSLLKKVGLGYLKLGHSSVDLSGGEAQRIKLASYLEKKNYTNILYILDEPSTGLHFFDIEKLLNVFKEILERDNTVVVIEHNLDIIKFADHIIDLGNHGGDMGGQIAFEGKVSEIIKRDDLYTGIYLRNKIENDAQKN